jgi:dTDP-4-dehydro-6-deoxy-alpha-D-glucopyranose 2,3-dehydratase
MKILSSYFESLSPNSFTVNSLKEIKDWIKDSNEKINVELIQTPLCQLSSWNYSPSKISHNSGRFFSIEGIKVKGYVDEKSIGWSQPIINQPEHGYLGIIVREFNGVLHFLLQAKIEPGNVNKVQLSPTIQATRSNFSRVHKGRSPDYLEDFINPDPSLILVDQLQTEQGARFLKKRNRNVIIYSNNVEALDDRFKWLTMWQIQQMMRYNNTVNMDTRTVLSCMPFQFTQNHLMNLDSISVKDLISFNPLFSDNSVNSNEYILNWLTQRKLRCDIAVESISLQELRGWKINMNEISHEEKKFFKVIGVNVSIENREVTSWSQPMIQPCEKGLIALGYCSIDSVPHFLVRAKFEIGSFDKIEFAPSIQTSFSSLSSDDQWVLEQFSSGDKVFSVFQSEEGGRFFHEENLNELYKIPYIELNDYASNFQWMTYTQIQQMMSFSGLVNIQLRTLLSMIQSGL